MTDTGLRDFEDSALTQTPSQKLYWIVRAILVLARAIVMLRAKQ